MAGRDDDHHRELTLVAIALAACGGRPPAAAPSEQALRPIANPARDIVDTRLAFDVTAHTGSALPGGLLLGALVPTAIATLAFRLL